MINNSNISELYIMAYSCPNAAKIAFLLIFSVLLKAKAQISTPCTSSVISSFTPCINYVTGSSGTGSSPSEDCCNSLKSLTTDNMDCACLIVTGNVPVSIPFINANLAISLPQACKSSVPLQCKATGVPLPAPGPVLFGPTHAPAPHGHHRHSPEGPSLAPAPHSTHSPKGPSLGPKGPSLAPAPHSTHNPKGPSLAPASHSHSPKVSKAAAAAAPPPVDSLDITPASPPKFALGPSSNPGIRPVLNPNSASSPAAAWPPSLVLMFVGIMALKFF